MKRLVIGSILKLTACFGFVLCIALLGAVAESKTFIAFLQNSFFFFLCCGATYLAGNVGCYEMRKAGKK